jgi:transcriptional regulator with XRE-family HTH domain
MERNVTPADVSRGTGIATATLTNWKKGKYTPKIDKLQKIADYFGVSITYFTGSDVENSEQHEGYYVNTETAALAEKLLTDSHYRVLFDAARDSRPEDLQMAADLLRRLKGERDE